MTGSSLMAIAVVVEVVCSKKRETSNILPGESSRSAILNFRIHVERNLECILRYLFIERESEFHSFALVFSRISLFHVEE
jgi:hypothetical protein